MKIYVASSWRNKYQQKVVTNLRMWGHKVYDFKYPKPGYSGFAWSEISPNWETWTTDEYVKALDHPIAIKGFNNDFEAMQWAECCVLVNPSGRSAHTEAGWMKGAGKLVYVFQPVKMEAELMYKCFDGVFSQFTDLFKVVGRYPEDVDKLKKVVDN